MCVEIMGWTCCPHWMCSVLVKLQMWICWDGLSCRDPTQPWKDHAALEPLWGLGKRKELPSLGEKEDISKYRHCLKALSCASPAK